MLGALDRLDAFVILTAFSSFVIFLVIHVVGFRCLRPEGAGRVLRCSFALGLLANVASSALLAVAPVYPLGAYSIEAIVVSSATAVWIYIMLIFHYMIWVFGMGEAAIRIRLLREIYQTPAKAATLQEIYRAYNGDMIVRVRLARLVGSGHLRFDGRRYSVGRRVLFIQSGLMRLTKCLMGIPTDKS